MTEELRSYERPADDDWVRVCYVDTQVSNAQFAITHLLSREEVKEIRDRATKRFNAWLASR